MGFNYAKEKMRFESEWEKLQEKYVSAGMTPEAIESMRTYDWSMFLSRRNYENHTQPLPDTYFSGESEDERTTLFRKFASLTATFGEEDFPGRYKWIDSIDSIDLSFKLKSLSIGDLELLTLYAIDGRTQAEIASLLGRDQSVISRKIKRIKKFLKK